MCYYFSLTSIGDESLSPSISGWFLDFGKQNHHCFLSVFLFWLIRVRSRQAQTKRKREQVLKLGRNVLDPTSIANEWHSKTDQHRVTTSATRNQLASCNSPCPRMALSVVSGGNFGASMNLGSVWFNNFTL